MVLWMTSVYFQSGTLMFLVLTAVETLVVFGLAKTASCCKKQCFIVFDLTLQWVSSL